MSGPGDESKRAWSPAPVSGPSVSPQIEAAENLIEFEDWAGPDDPENPHNWPLWKRILHSAIPAVYAFGLCVGISTFVASVPAIQLEFGISSRNVALLPVSLYTAGFIIGPCIASPVSELYGRRWIYWTNFPMLFIFSAIAAASKNFTVLVIFRLLAGVGGSGVLAVGAGTLSDLWDMKNAALVGIAYILAPFMGPTLGPLIGAYVIHQYNDWRWVVWVVLCIMAPVGVALLFMKETSKVRILRLRVKRRGGHVEERSASETARKVGKAMFRPLHMCMIEPLSLILGLYTAYSFAMIFSFFGSYALVYARVYDFDQRQIGLCFLPVVVGFLFAVATFGYFNATVYQKEAIRTNGRAAPEFLFYGAMFGCWLVPVGLFWYAWAPQKGVHWIVPVLAGLPFGWGTLAGFMSSMAYLVEVYGVANAASAVAANGMLRFALGAAFPQFIIQVYQSRLGIHWTGSIFAFISVVMIPVPYIIFWKGRELRRRSHYPTNSN